jgi:uncharacterized protein YprB with RNaseH-like and TPR domain
VIHSTFRLAPGIGAALERRIWSAGILRWEDLDAHPGVLGARTEARLRAAIAEASRHLAAGDADALAALLPRSERWRLYGAFGADAAFLDLEMDGDGITAIGVLDRHGPRLFLAGERRQPPGPPGPIATLEDFPDATRGWKLLVTFNGLSFDVPILERAFRGWRAPRAHVDLRQLWGRLGHQGGLKLLEHDTGVGRPANLHGLDGRAAVGLWRRHLDGDADALRLFAEYNLHDAVNLRTLMDLAWNELVERLRLPAPKVVVQERGDVRYDLTKLLLAL